MKFLHLFRKKSVFDIAAEELDEAQRDLLSHQRASEYHAQMIRYCEVKIARLNKITGTKGAA